MKPSTVTSILLVEDRNSPSSSFLLQGALHFAEQGFPVCVISMNKVQSLPPPLHGTIMPGADVFSLIRFVYLSTWQDLLQHLYSIHLHAQVPSVIILESIEKYFSLKPNDNLEETDKTNINIQHAALICASLMDAGAVCAERLKKPTHILVSVKQSSLQENTLNTIINTFFTDFTWFIKTEQADDIDSENKVVLSSPNKKCTLTFSQPKDMILYLKEIIVTS